MHTRILALLVLLTALGTRADWELVAPPASPLPHNERVTALCADKRGALWLGSFAQQLYRYHNNSWQIIDSTTTKLRGSSINYLYCDAQGTLWANGGPVLNTQNYTITTRGDLVRFDGTSWSRIAPTQGGWPGANISSMIQDANATLWIAMNDQEGLVSFDGSRWRHYYSDDVGVTLDDVQALAASPDGRLWIGTDSAGIYIRSSDGRFDSLTTRNSQLPDNHITSLLYHGETLWVGTADSGVVCMRDTVCTTFPPVPYYRAPVPETYGRVLGVDANDQVWVAGAYYLARAALTGPWTINYGECSDAEMGGSDPGMSCYPQEVGPVFNMSVLPTGERWFSGTGPALMRGEPGVVAVKNFAATTATAPAHNQRWLVLPGATTTASHTSYQLNGQKHRAGQSPRAAGLYLRRSPAAH